MSDFGRKSFTDQATDKITPESQKPTTQKLGDTASGAYDRTTGAVQPDSQKSTTQKATDSLRSGSDDASSRSKGVAQSATDTADSAARGVKDTIGSVTGNK
ncbi:unnamed protein product [Tuber melanosporum]|jgi:uncharacterized protein YjbJ (UPF0337 family)|uniref:(Perigord truffle) hypothetical protein n=1 Tax=Tuber melanosporum (strain Mel28) TaxID=656061 RepID=D5G7R7_TUBMM|nr:uncharacterized protein GSTUM_00004694001 [Tuber melanosporum]CAZ80560.1 unnamed protein product [Tuber melanosporum]